MKTIEKTHKRITIEITQQEVNSKGWDFCWDNLRDIYKEHQYSLENIDSTLHEGRIIIVTLKPKKLLDS